MNEYLSFFYISPIAVEAVLGWRVLVVWECWLKDMGRTSTIFAGFLDGVETVGNHE